MFRRSVGFDTATSNAVFTGASPAPSLRLPSITGASGRNIAHATYSRRWPGASRGFQIDYARGEANEPDFVVETKTEKFMCEIKRADQLQHPDVQAKAKAAVTWCVHATAHEAAHDGKPWRYLPIPHDAVTENMTVGGLAAKYAVSAA